jgi:hypothetical protein
MGGRRCLAFALLTTTLVATVVVAQGGGPAADAAGGHVASDHEPAPDGHVDRHGGEHDAHREEAMAAIDAVKEAEVRKRRRDAHARHAALHEAVEPNQRPKWDADTAPLAERGLHAGVDVTQVVLLALIIGIPFYVAIRTIV